MNELDPSQRIELDARNLRGIAHPVRVRLLGMLRLDGPSTATALAHRLGLNSGATSYHLRQLAEHGFVVDDAERGTGRERWWKAAHLSTSFTQSDLAADSTGMGEAFMRALAHEYANAMVRAVDEMPTLPESWRSAGQFSDAALQLTAEELKELVAEVSTVVRRYRRAMPGPNPDAPRDSARVRFLMQAFPLAESLESDAEADPGAQA